ncbi:MAG: type II toxin-antitoxin system CcdA family antitoxin [Hyphomicrobium sp.]
MNLSIDADLLDEARAAGTNLSSTLEIALGEALRSRRWQAWRAQNADAIRESNDELGRNGMWYTPEWSGT